MQQLKAEQIIIWTGYDGTATNSRPKISDTSDSDWPDEIKKTWPVFIMGASQMWLDLVKEYSLQVDVDLESKSRYQEVQKHLDEVWKNQGHHAWLHHLNALHAYQPLLMRY